MFAHLGLVGVVGAPVVEVVAEAGHKEAEHLEVIHEPGRKKCYIILSKGIRIVIVLQSGTLSNIHCLPVHLAGLHHGEHGLTHVEGVAPVVVLHRPVVLLHAQRPPTHNLLTCERVNGVTLKILAL